MLAVFVFLQANLEAKLFLLLSYFCSSYIYFYMIHKLWSCELHHDRC